MNVRLFKRFFKKAGTQAFVRLIPVQLLLLLRAAPAAAAGAGGTMPWDGPLNTLADDIQGPLVTAGLIFAIVVGCLLLAFGDFATGGKRIVLTVIAGSIALGILRFFTALGIVGALLR
jgi:type IV secretory pathway VirB2 component (pilin)